MFREFSTAVPCCGGFGNAGCGTHFRLAARLERGPRASLAVSPYLNRDKTSALITSDFLMGCPGLRNPIGADC